MSGNEQIIAFANELDKLVDKFAMEFDLSYSAVIGTLFTKAHLLVDQARGENSDDDS